MSRDTPMVLVREVVIVLTAYAGRMPPYQSIEWVPALSVRASDIDFFMRVLVALWMVTVGLLAYVQYTAEPLPVVLHIVPGRSTDSGHVYQVGERVNNIATALVITAMVATPILKVGIAAARALYLLLAHRLPRRVAMAIVNVLSRSFVERRVSEIRAEGEAVGYTKGEAQTNQVWQEWNRRRMEAESEGRVFTEPPPA